MNSNPTPQNSESRCSSAALVLVYLVTQFGESLTDAMAERFLDWINRHDWAAVIGWILTQAQNLPSL